MRIEKENLTNHYIPVLEACLQEKGDKGKGELTGSRGRTAAGLRQRSLRVPEVYPHTEAISKRTVESRTGQPFEILSKTCRIWNTRGLTNPNVGAISRLGKPKSVNKKLVLRKTLTWDPKR